MVIVQYLFLISTRANFDYGYFYVRELNGSCKKRKTVCCELL